MKRYKTHIGISSPELKTGNIRNPDVPSYLFLETKLQNPLIIGTTPDLKWNSIIDVNEIIKSNEFTGRWYISSPHLKCYDVEYYKFLKIKTNKEDHEYFKTITLEFISTSGLLAELSIDFDGYSEFIIEPTIEVEKMNDCLFDLTCPDKSFYRRTVDTFEIISIDGNNFPLLKLINMDNSKVEYEKEYVHIIEKNII